MAHRGITGFLRTLRGRWWVFFHRRCLVGFPWFWPARPPGEHAMVAARRMVRRHFGRDHHPAQRALARALTMTAWPLAVLIHLWRIRRFSGPKEMPIRRAPGAIWAAMRHNILPGEYYAYALWRPERRMKIDNYLYSHEAARIFKLSTDRCRTIRSATSWHSMRCARCTRFLARQSWRHSLQPASCWSFSLDSRRSLICSSSHALGSPGMVPSGFAGAGALLRASAAVAWGDRIWLTTSQRARVNEKRTLLVQPNLSNHPDLRVQTNGALATARLVTGHSTDGDVVAIFGLIYFARSDRITVQHGRVALIDVASGRLVPAPLEDGTGARNSNPQADDARCDFMLPDWQAAVQHAKVAHRACSNIAFVGWDIAFTDHGPMLLEGNANWTADEYQSLTGEPLGHTQFATVLATRLRCQFTSCSVNFKRLD